MIAHSYSFEDFPVKSFLPLINFFKVADICFICHLIIYEIYNFVTILLLTTNDMICVCQHVPIAACQQSKKSQQFDLSIRVVK